MKLKIISLLFLLIILVGCQKEGSYKETNNILESNKTSENIKMENDINKEKNNLDDSNEINKEEIKTKKSDITEEKAISMVEELFLSTKLGDANKIDEVLSKEYKETNTFPNDGSNEKTELTKKERLELITYRLSIYSLEKKPLYIDSSFELINENIAIAKFKVNELYKDSEDYNKEIKIDFKKEDGKWYINNGI